jgi:hypothetical protein
MRELVTAEMTATRGVLDKIGDPAALRAHGALLAGIARDLRAVAFARAEETQARDTYLRGLDMVADGYAKAGAGDASGGGVLLVAGDAVMKEGRTALATVCAP